MIMVTMDLEIVAYIFLCTAGADQSGMIAEPPTGEAFSREVLMNHIEGLRRAGLLVGKSKESPGSGDVETGSLKLTPTGEILHYHLRSRSRFAKL